jgi:hypothetical protein
MRSIRRRLTVALAAAGLLVIPATAAFAQSADATVWVVHAVPGVDVDVWANGNPLLTGFSPRDTERAQVPAGDYDIEVYPAGADPDGADPVITFSGNVTAGANVTLVAHLTASGEIAPQLALFANDVSRLGADQTRVTVRHTAAAPEVELLGGGDVLGSFSVGGQLGPLDLPAGTIPVGVALPGDDPFFEADLAFAAGTATFVHAYASDPSDPTGTFAPIVFSVDVDVPTPSAVHSGTGGDAAGMTGWVVVAMALGASGMLVPVLARRNA